jgi:cytochrome c peroxidase
MRVTFKRTFLFYLTAVSLTLFLPSACGDSSSFGRVDSFFSEVEWDVIRTLSPVPAPPPASTNRFADNPLAAALGQKFFFDPRFSGPLVNQENFDTAQGGNGSAGQAGNPLDGAIERIACATCHNPSTSFADLRTISENVSLGTDFGQRNVPTILNSAFNDFFHFDGISDSQWAQALKPIENPAEHNFNRVSVALVILQNHQNEFEAIFGPLPNLTDATRFPQIPNPPTFVGQGRPGDSALDPTPAGALDTFDGMSAADQTLINGIFANFGKAIAAYERLLISRDSQFDRFVAGDNRALSADQKRGLKLFLVDALCVTCHNGPNFTNNQFHNLGVKQAGDHVPSQDPGRFAAVPILLASPFNGVGPFSDDVNAGARKLAGLTQDNRQLGQFKTPTLRDIDLTGAYFHTGAQSSLWDAVDFYNHAGDRSGFSGVQDVRIGDLNMSETQVNDIVSFLRTLNGAPLPTKLTTAPAGIPFPPP